MNSQARILKDGRALFWLWLAVAGAGFLPSLFQSNPRLMGLSGSVALATFLLGIPVLAMFAFGMEFQHRTMPLLLSLPVARVKIWAEKSAISLLAVLSAGLAYFIGFRSLPYSPQFWPYAGWLVLTTCAAGFWVLLARTLVGGFVLNVAAQMFFMFAGSYYFELQREAGASYTTTVSTLFVVAFSYCVVMLELGRRRLARFQIKDAMAGDDLLMSATRFLPRPLAAVVRSSSSSPTLNLIRKEINLFRPFWLLTALAAVGLIALVPFRFVSVGSALEIKTSDFDSVASFLGVIVIFVYWLIAALLAGSISIAEEKAAGTHSWHVTLPISVFRQWSIKLGFGLIANFITLFFLVNFGRLVLGAGFVRDVEKVLLATDAYHLFLMSLFSFPAFWCASVLRGTARAALFVFPVSGAVAAATMFGTELNWGRPLMDSLIQKFHPFPFTAAQMLAASEIRSFWLFTPIATLAVLQTYRLFRVEIRENLRSVLPYFLPVLATGFLAGASYGFFDNAVHRVMPQIASTLHETRFAVGKMKLDYAQLDAAHPLEIPLKDLLAAAPLSSTAQGWLEGARVTVAPAHTDFVWLKLKPSPVPYFTTIHLAQGWDCTIYGGNSWHCKASDGTSLGTAPAR